MRLAEALQINAKLSRSGAAKRSLHLVCGISPLHLETLLAAYAGQRFGDSPVQIIPGLFGDLDGNLRRAAVQSSEAALPEGAIVVIEWSDFDDRLGLRSSAGWTSAVLADILPQVEERCAKLTASISALASVMPVVVVGPTLSLPPLTHFPTAQSSPFELAVQAAASQFLAGLSSVPNVRIASASRLDFLSPSSDRHDVKMDLHAGFPYAVPHAAAVARLAAETLVPTPAKKGLITDLDDTLWQGILGDVGVSGVSWCLDSKSQAHALYQQFLSSLAESGILVGIASKNDPTIVQQAFERSDTLIKPAQIFPIEAGWGPKSEAVKRILAAWNVGADSVVFVDDSPMEIAEVTEALPAVTCLRFPAGDPAAILELIQDLREHFGKSEVRNEDRLRLQSLRASADVQQPPDSAQVSQDFLERLQAKLTFTLHDSAGVGRPFELVNKTNQFNLNGHRYTPAEWLQYFRDPNAFLLTADYEDRFGPLGKIAVLGGRRAGTELHVDTWVLSCRAFSRGIEFQVLRQLMQHFAASAVTFAYVPTARNGPTTEFLHQLFARNPLPEPCRLTLSEFESHCPSLFHEVISNWTPSETSLLNASR